jgi:hypothetical protein
MVGTVKLILVKIAQVTTSPHHPEVLDVVGTEGVAWGEQRKKGVEKPLCCWLNYPQFGATRLNYC